MIAVKRIINYVNGTSDYGIWYSRDSNDWLVRYANADCFYVWNNLVSWMSKKQNSVFLSTAEVEYIVVGSCCAQLLWMKKLHHDCGISQDTMCVFCDNTSAINLSNNYSTLKVKTYQNSLSFHSRLDGGENFMVGIYQHWQSKGWHFY